MISAALHIAAAALICVIFGVTPPIFVLSLLLALLPDIDTPRSIIGNLLLSVSHHLERSVGHRTATHSLAAVAVVAAATYLWLPAWWPILAGAYGSHLLLDLLIGPSGIALVWPLSRQRLIIAGWRDDGPAPRRMLFALTIAAVAVACWPLLQPAMQPHIDIAVAVANPISEATPTRTPAPTPTPAPAIQIQFTLPPSVPLSAVRVGVGDTITEGQILATWDSPTPTPIPTPTLPIVPAPPLAPPAPPAPAALIEAEAALAALELRQAADRQRLAAQDSDEHAVVLMEHAAERLVAVARVDVAQSRATESAQAAAWQAAATATAWQAAATATAEEYSAAWQAAVATAAPPPNVIRSRTDGLVLDIMAEERDGTLVVTLRIRR